MGRPRGPAASTIARSTPGTLVRLPNTSTVRPQKVRLIRMQGPGVQSVIQPGQSLLSTRTGSMTATAISPSKPASTVSSTTVSK